MKQAILTILLLASSSGAQAIEMKKVLYNYVFPCAASIAVGTILDQTNGQTMGLVVCAGTSTFAAMQDMSDSRAATMNDVNKMAILLKRHNEKVAADIFKDLGGKMDQVSNDRQAFLNELRAQVQKAVADQSMFMSEQMAERLKTAMSSPDFIPDLMQRINSRVKAEVASEFDLRRSSLIREAVNDVLNSITVKPVAIPEGKVVSPKKPKKESKYEDED